MVKRVFYIEKEKFLRSLMEMALKKKGLDVYTVDTLKDHFYLIEDLKPEVIIFDWDTCQDAPSLDFEKLLSYGEGQVIIATTSKDKALKEDKRISGHLEKPLVVAELAETILSLVRKGKSDG